MQKPIYFLFSQLNMIINFRVVREPFPALCTLEKVEWPTICRTQEQRQKRKKYRTRSFGKFSKYTLITFTSQKLLEREDT